MTDLATMLQNPDAYRGAADDLMRRLGIGPAELAQITLCLTPECSGRYARELVAQFLTMGGTKMPAGEETAQAASPAPQPSPPQPPPENLPAVGKIFKPVPAEPPIAGGARG